MKVFNKKTQNTGEKLQVPNRQIKYVEGQTDNKHIKKPNSTYMQEEWLWSDNNWEAMDEQVLWIK